MTWLVTSIPVRNLDHLPRHADAAWSAGTDAVELRIDPFEGEPDALAAFVAAHRNRRLIVTCRGPEEGGAFTGTIADRAALLSAVATAGPAYIDVEATAWATSSDIRDAVRSAIAGAGRVGLILSAHSFDHAPPDVTAIVRDITAVQDSTVAKVAYVASDAADNFPALDTLHNAATPTTASCMGDAGIVSRVLAKKLGGFATYVALTPDAATAPGQITLDTIKQLYRWDTIDAATRVFGVIGDPVAHSMGPHLFHRWFAQTGINAVYLPLLVRANGDGLTRWLTGCIKRPWLDVGGFSVTMPHKQAAAALVGSGVDRAATNIGAVNTIVLRDGRLLGYNTDARAAAQSIAAALGCTAPELDGVTVDVLGTGGAARAVVSGLCDAGAQVTVYGRSPDRTAAVADACACTPAAWHDRAASTADVLVNCTSIGMSPDTDATPMPTADLGCRALVFDVVYNPMETKLLTDARLAGAATLSGVDMFVRQAAMQFELWTRHAADVESGRAVVVERLRRMTGDVS
ncbi:MAG: type I 3-dehydroquinate dehydratase [Phycisphaerae bacterium]